MARGEQRSGSTRRASAREVPCGRPAATGKRGATAEARELREQRGVAESFPGRRDGATGFPRHRRHPGSSASGEVGPWCGTAPAFLRRRGGDELPRR